MRQEPGTALYVGDISLQSTSPFYSMEPAGVGVLEPSDLGLLKKYIDTR
jgi:hypothetical protein